MTLGGMALAVGILVDDATVAIENINRNLEAGKELEQSILDGSAQIAIPALVSTLSICIVFVPMFLLSGVARYLFVPMAEAVVFAMLASYLLSRTAGAHHGQVPASRARRRTTRIESAPAAIRSFISSLRSSPDSKGFAGFTSACSRCASTTPRSSSSCFSSSPSASLGILAPWLGQDFFPSVDAGQFKIHVRARTGTRIEETAALCDHVDATIREQIPAQ